MKKTQTKKSHATVPLRWILLYINWKLFSRVIVGHHKMLILLKGHFTINKRRSSVRSAQRF